MAVAVVIYSRNLDEEAENAATRHRLDERAADAAAAKEKLHKKVAVSIGKFLSRLPGTREIYRTIREKETGQDEIRHWMEPLLDFADTPATTSTAVETKHGWQQVGSK